MGQEHEGLLHRLFGRHPHAAMAPAALNLDDTQGFILRGYRMPMVRHLLLKVRAPAPARLVLGGSSAARKPIHRRSRLRGTRKSVSSRDP